MKCHFLRPKRAPPRPPPLHPTPPYAPPVCHVYLCLHIWYQTCVFAYVQLYTNPDVRQHIPTFLLTPVNDLLYHTVTAIVHATSTSPLFLQYIQTKIMAVWGAPLADANRATHAAECALQMQQEHALLLRRWKHRNVRAKISIGIATGQAIVGEMGPRMRSSYTVMGRIVNLAARIMSSCDPGAIRVCDATHKLIVEQPGSTFTTLPHEEVFVRGIEHGLTMHSLLAGTSGLPVSISHTQV